MVDRRRPPGADAFPEFLRLPATLGSAGLLGGDHRHQHGRGSPHVRAGSQPVIARRAGYRRGRLIARLFAARDLAPPSCHPGDKRSLLQSGT